MFWSGLHLPTFLVSRENLWLDFSYLVIIHFFSSQFLSQRIEILFLHLDAIHIFLKGFREVFNRSLFLYFSDIWYQSCGNYYYVFWYYKLRSNFNFFFFFENFCNQKLIYLFFLLGRNSYFLYIKRQKSGFELACSCEHERV